MNMNSLRLLSGPWTLKATPKRKPSLPRPFTSSSSFSSKLKDIPTPAVCLSKDGSAFLAYHPQRDFPYEHSRPLPPSSASIEDTDDPSSSSSSPLKIQITKAFKEKKSKQPNLTLKDLGEMFGDRPNYFRAQPQERKRAEVAEYQKMLKRKTLNELPED